MNGCTGGQIIESLTDPLLYGEIEDILGVCAQYVEELEGCQGAGFQVYRRVPKLVYGDVTQKSLLFLSFNLSVKTLRLWTTYCSNIFPIIWQSTAWLNTSESWKADLVCLTVWVLFNTWSRVIRNDLFATILQQADLSTMKILHALVGYLAVAALPFSPFSFAHPLAAIDFDGYVNTTQNLIDGALRNHISGEIIEARQLDIVDVAIVLDIVALVYVTLIWIGGDNDVRADVFLVDHFD